MLRIEGCSLVYPNGVCSLDGISLSFELGRFIVLLGQAAGLRFSAFNQRTTPEVTGTLTRISADVSQDQRSGQSYYVVRIGISHEEVARLGNNAKLVPGDAGRDVHLDLRPHSPLLLHQAAARPDHACLPRALSRQSALSPRLSLGAAYSLALSAARKVGIVEFGQSEELLVGSCSNAGYHSSHHPHPGPARRPSALAAQRPMGLRPVRRGGGHLDHRAYSGAVGPYLAPSRSNTPHEFKSSWGQDRSRE